MIWRGWIVFLILGLCAVSHTALALDYEDYPSIRLRTLDKITARTLTFDAKVGNTVKFGDIYIKIQTCRKPPAIEKDESAAFLQIWEVNKTTSASQWIFSGWMFASSPSLSAMDHPVYDVWVIECFGKEAAPQPTEETNNKDALPDEGTVSDDTIVKPEAEPDVPQENTSEETHIDEAVQKAKTPETSVDDAPKIYRDDVPQQNRVTPETETIEGIY